jgi:hypothetical protein
MITIVSKTRNFIIAFFCSLHGYQCIECIRYTRCPVVNEIEEDAKKEKERINE